MKNKSVTFLYGQGLKKDFKQLEKYFYVPKIDWNTWEVKIPKGTEILIGFSMGATLACEYCLTHKIEHLILCSLMPGIETLKKIKAKNVIFLVGEEEGWTLSEVRRVYKTVKSKKSLVVIPKGRHDISGTYQKKLIETIENIS